jgi:small multidrug resistance family-3 protein
MMPLLRAGALFVLTALCEIAGCYLPYLWLRRGGALYLLLPAAASLVAFVWLLSLHPISAGRTYAAYGGVYIMVAMLWLWLAERQVPTTWDLAGAALCVSGAAVIVLGAR